MKKITRILGLLLTALIICSASFSAYADEYDEYDPAVEEEFYGIALADAGEEVQLYSDFDTSLPYNTPQSDGSLVFDMADILNDNEESALEERLEALSAKYGMDVAVVTNNSLDGKTPMEWADDYYDYNGYGQGENHDGVVLMLSMNERDWWFSTTGRAIKVFSDSAIDYIFSSDNVLGYFAYDDWYQGFCCYANMIEKGIVAAENGDKFPPVEGSTVLMVFAGCIFAGFIVALIYKNNVKAKYKTVRAKAGASDYLVAGSLNLTKSVDQFLYSSVTRTARPKESSSSSTHSSSSGTSHGGGGGKF